MAIRRANLDIDEDLLNELEETVTGIVLKLKAS